MKAAKNIIFLATRLKNLDGESNASIKIDGQFFHSQVVPSGKTIGHLAWKMAPHSEVKNIINIGIELETAPKRDVENEYLVTKINK